MIAFTDAQRSSAADQLQAYALWAVASRRDAEHCADLALAAVADDVATILRALKESRQEHYTCEDCFYSCRLADGCNDSEAEGECSCGADTWNARIDAALAAWQA